MYLLSLKSFKNRETKQTGIEQRHGGATSYTLRNRLQLQEFLGISLAWSEWGVNE